MGRNIHHHGGARRGTAIPTEFRRRLQPLHLCTATSRLGHRSTANRNRMLLNRFGSAENLLEKVVQYFKFEFAYYDSRGRSFTARIKNTNLSNMAGAIVGKLRVVLTQCGHVQPFRFSNYFTCFTVFDNMSGQAVLDDKIKADDFALLEAVVLSAV